MTLKEKVIEIICKYDMELVDALDFDDIIDAYLIITAENRDRLIDLMQLFLKYDMEEYGNDAFFNAHKITIDTKKKRIKIVSNRIV